MSGVPTLEVRGLNLGFDLFEGRSHVLNDVALEIRKGERVALVGESGCGKSVFVRLVLGLLNQRNLHVDGSIRFDGQDLRTLSATAWREIRGRRISMIFQDPIAALNPVFTIGDQLSEVIKRGGTARGHRHALEIARDALRLVAIEDPDRVLASYPFQLSGGMNQRVLITMALVNRPELVLADEPGTALDVTVQEQTLRLMRQLTQEVGAALLLIAHNLGVVREFAERAYVMYAGTIVEEGTVEALFQDPKHPYTQALIAAVPRLTGGVLPKSIAGYVPDYTTPPPGCRFHPRCPHATEQCKSRPPLIELGPDRRVACVLYAEQQPENATMGHA
ncbi:MAG: ABC transporter ATP-binding protein [Alphaproteobacteria bacterium]